MQVSSMTMPGISPTAAVPSTERTEKRENDGDGDDNKAGAAAPRSQSINLNGEVTGQLIHATA